MFSIDILCADRFSPVRYSDRGIEELARFVKNKLQLNNQSQEYDQFITDLNNAISAFGGERQDIYDERSSQKSKTFVVDNIINDFLEVVHSKEIMVRYVFGGYESEEYIDCFPHRLKPYNNPSKETIVKLLNHLILFGTTYEAQLGADFKTVFTDFKTQFLSKNDEQQDVMGTITDNIVLKNIYRKTLTVLMTSILFYLCSKNVDKPAEIKKIFKLSILTKHQKHTKNTIIETGTVAANETMMINDKIKSTNSFVFKNLSTVPLLFCLGIEGETACVTGVTVGAGEIEEKSFADFGHTGDFVLKVTNTSLDTEADYSVDITV